MEVISALFSNTWNFISSISVPGFAFTFGAVFYRLRIYSIKVLTAIFGIGIGTVSTSMKQKGGNNRNYKIANERQGDSK